MKPILCLVGAAAAATIVFFNTGSTSSKSEGAIAQQGAPAAKVVPDSKPKIQGLRERARAGPETRAEGTNLLNGEERQFQVLVQDDQGPVSGCRIVAYFDDEEARTVQTCGDDGLASFERRTSPASKSVAVELSHPGYVRKRAQAAVGERDVIQLRLQRETTIDGSLLRANLAEMKQVVVTAWPVSHSPSRSALRDAAQKSWSWPLIGTTPDPRTGEFRLTGVAAGARYIVVASTGTKLSEPVPVRAGSKNCHLALRNLYAGAFSVVGEDGTALQSSGNVFSGGPSWQNNGAFDDRISAANPILALTNLASLAMDFSQRLSRRDNILLVYASEETVAQDGPVDLYHVAPGYNEVEELLWLPRLVGELPVTRIRSFGRTEVAWGSIEVIAHEDELSGVDLGTQDFLGIVTLEAESGDQFSFRFPSESGLLTASATIPVGDYHVHFKSRRGDFTYPERGQKLWTSVSLEGSTPIVLDLFGITTTRLNVKDTDSDEFYSGPLQIELVSQTSVTGAERSQYLGFKQAPYEILGLAEGDYKLRLSSFDDREIPIAVEFGESETHLIQAALN